MGAGINEYYGATETGIVVWHDSSEALRKPGTVGRVVEGATMRIVDEQGRDVKQGEVGEIYLRGPLFADFTYNNDDAKRREIALGDLVTVGDVGYQDADGYLFLCDRKRDMIISGGVNIYPAEIESVLIQMPGVRDCAVFGIPDEEFGEQICAHVEPLAGRADRRRGRAQLSRPAPGALQGAEGGRAQRRPAARGFGQDLQTQAARPILGEGGSQHLKEVMSDDDVTLFGKLKNKLIDSKQKWAEDGRLLTGKTAAPCAAPAAGPAPGRDLAGARSRHPARDPDPCLAPVRRRRGREPDDLEMGRIHRPAQDHADDRHPLRHRLVALRQQMGGRERAHLLEMVKPKADAQHVIFHSYDTYTTNVPLADFAADDVLLAWSWNGEPISREHGGPLRVVIPKLYFWKSAKWIKRIEFSVLDKPGFWEVRGYHNYGDPWLEQRYDEEG